MMRFTDATGRWQAVRSDMPLPVAGGQVLQWLSDDFATLNTDIWEVSGTPSVGSSELTLSAGQALLSRQGFQPPCLIEAVCTMTARAGTDDFRIGFYTDDNNLVEWRAAGTTGSNMDAVMRAGGVLDEQNGINVGAANNSYRLASIYVGVGEALWSFRNINSQVVRNEVYRIREHGIPNGPFRVRLAGLAGTSSLEGTPCAGVSVSGHYRAGCAGAPYRQHGYPRAVDEHSVRSAPHQHRAWRCSNNH
jgi:hypothetical protein